jgi:hypothetical protein
MRAKELKGCLNSPIPSLFRLDESKKADRLTRPILGWFHGLDESQIALALSQSYATRMRAKELKKCLSSPISSLFRLG